MKKSQIRKKLLEQKLMGIVLLLLSAILIVVAWSGSDFLDRDCTPVLLMVPGGIYLLTTNKIVIW